MKQMTARGWYLLVALVLLVSFPATLHAVATGCAVGATPCAAACGAGCPAATSIAHSAFPPDPGGGAGSFNLSGTQYENTCGNGSFFGGDCLGAGGTQRRPKLRFWKWNEYLGATGGNSGCEYPNDGPTPGGAAGTIDWMLNFEWDISGAPVAAYHGKWVMVQSQWNGTNIDGCPSGVASVVEISDVCPPAAAAPLCTVVGREGTVTHGAWYTLAAVPSPYDMDSIRGAGGGSGNTISPSAVPSVRLTGRTDPCTGSTTATMGVENTTDTSFFNIDVTLTDANPPWFDEVGLRGTVARPLIAGFQIMYAPTTEPTTSVAGVPWLAARSVAAPGNNAGFFPVSAASMMVALPKAGAPHWLAARIVYSAGAMANPPGAAGDTRIEVTSPLGGHCGPVAFGTVAVDYESVTAVRLGAGVLVKWTTAFEDDVAGFHVLRRTGSPTEAAERVTLKPERAHGPMAPYEFLDTDADPLTTYYYSVHEVTLSGAQGSESTLVEVIRLGDDDNQTTGGSRTRTRTAGSR